MALESAEVLKIAHLARLNLAAGDVAEVTARLGNILAMVDRLQAAATDGVEPLAHPLDAVQPLRADVVSERDRHSEFQRIAPATEAGLYLVPRVIE